MRDDIIYDLSVHAEQIFVRLVFILIDVPVGVHVVGIHSVPVLVLTFGGLVVLEPRLIVGGRERHEVLSYVRFVVTQRRAVLHILVNIVHVEVEIHRTETCVGTQVESVTAHVGVRQNILVTHIRIGETNTRLAGVHRYHSGVVGRQTQFEEVRCVVGNDQERMFLSVEVTKGQSAVCFRSPGLVGITCGIDIIHTVRAHTVHLLYVVPLTQLAVEGECSVVLNAPFGVARVGFLGGDKDHTVRCAATVEGCRCRTFEHRHRLDVIGVDRRNTVTEVITAFRSCRAEIGVIHRHSVHHVEGLVVTGHLGRTTQHDAR